MLQQRLTIINLLKLATAVSIFVYLFFLFFHTDYAMTQDLGRHLTLGRIIWETKTIPQTNLFSYTYPDFPFINHHWGAEVMFYLLAESFGINILVWLKVLLILLSFFLIFTYSLKKTGLTSLMAVSCIALQLIRERNDIRPEVFGYPLFSLLLIILFKERERGGKLIYLTPVLILFWVNLHISFVFGYALYLLFCLDRLIIKKFTLRYFLVGLLMVAIGLGNPYGISGLLYPLKIFSNYGYPIVENQSPFFLETVMRNPNILYFKIALFISVIFLPILLAKRMFFETLALMVFAVLSTQAVRHFPFPGLVFVLPLSIGLKELSSIIRIQERIIIKTKGIPLILFLIFFSGLLFHQSVDLFTNRNYIRKNSLAKTGTGFIKGMEDTVDYFQQNNLKGPIFNNFDIGSYLIYRLHPEERVFVDGRPEAYPNNFFQKIYIPMQEDERLWKEIERKFGFNTIIFSHTDMTPWGRKFIIRILKDPIWQPSYFDGFGFIMTKRTRPIEVISGSEEQTNKERLSSRIAEEMEKRNLDSAERKYWENFLYLARISES